MKTATKILALGGACAACCVAPVAIQLLATLFAGSVLFAGGGNVLPWMAGVAAVAVVAFLLLRLLLAFRKSGFATKDACGCSAAASVVRSMEGEPAVIACTLSPDDFRERAARIRALAERSLLSARRETLRLHLTYAPEAAEDVRALVREEQKCCAFLHFEVLEDARSVRVTITAPEEARDTASELFTQFAPELAREPASIPANPKEPVPS